MQINTVVVFEDNDFRGFGPLIDTRLIMDLRCGAYTFTERIEHQSGVKVYVAGNRSLVNNLYSNSLQTKDKTKLTSKDVIYVNGRVIYEKSHLEILLKCKPNTAFYNSGILIATRLTTENSSNLLSDFSIDELLNISKSFRAEQIEGVKIFTYPWELINRNPVQIEKDCEMNSYNQSVNPEELPEDIFIRNESNIQLGKSTTFGPGTIINAARHRIIIDNEVSIGSGVILEAIEGPIWLENNCVIESGAILKGPVYIGSNSIVRTGARLSEGVTLGPHCRVGGEVSRSVLHSYSNKQHSGYLGNTYIGSWVNLGAATDTSDLKNNYRPVSVTIDGKDIDTGDLHVGSIIGDFVKSAIHTRLNTGTVVGVCCNLFGQDFPPKVIPPFTWVSSEGLIDYKFDKAIETIRLQMPRRNKVLTPELISVLKSLYQGKNTPY